MGSTFIKNSSEYPFKIVLDAVIEDLEFEEDAVLIDNKTILSLANDYESGKWRHEKFQDFLWDNISESALPLSETEKTAVNKPFTTLKQAAIKLRLDENGGEIGEILLYAILKHYYGAVPIVPKIFYKQNVNDYAKGADSVHIIKVNDKITYWLGEAKFYNSCEKGRLKTVVNSIKSTLDDAKLKKEFSIVTSLEGLSKYLEPNDFDTVCKDLSDGISLDQIKKTLHVPILYLHECAKTNESIQSSFDEYLNILEVVHKELTKTFFEIQDEESKDLYGYSDITFHLILFPIPKKDTIMTKFNNKAQFFRQ